MSKFWRCRPVMMVCNNHLILSNIKRVIEIKYTTPLARVEYMDGTIRFCQRDTIPFQQRVDYWKEREADLTDGQI